MYLEFVILFFLFLTHGHTEHCTTPNNKPGECISFPSCVVLYEQAQRNVTVEEFVEKSICGGTKIFPKVCCESQNSTISATKDSTSTQRKNINKLDLLASKKYCGYQHSDDYFRSDNDTSIRITEFPWLAQLLFTSKSDGEEVSMCSGSLISTKYILTAAHCLFSSYYTVTGVRLGEFHIRNQTDCIHEQQFEEECSNPVQNFGIEKIIPHPNYNNKRKINDIALLRLNKTVAYSDYIRPICLPLLGTNLAQLGDILITSGWGKNHSDQGALFKKKVFKSLITNEECASALSKISTRFNITESHMCTRQLGDSTDEECAGDSGGPVMFSRRAQWHQEGIVSFAAGCVPNQVATHARVVNYLKWILDNLEP